MAIVKWTPFLESFDEINKMMSNFPLSAQQREQGGFVPAVDMYENEKDIVVEVQLSGIDPENVEVSIENDVLSIKGESEKKSEIDEKNYYKKEIRRGSFYRNIQLPTHVLKDETRAIAESGVLKVVIPKSVSVKSKKIKIETK